MVRDPARRRGVGPQSSGGSGAGVLPHARCLASFKASHGVVVNTASLTALISFKNTGTLAHTTAKAGIIGMTRQLAMEGREHGIRANSISPGVVETNQTREQLKDPEWAGYMLGETLLVVSVGRRKWRTWRCSWRPKRART
jgi:NAD(P)-dependent dehydrogenase (short-subunit alcohol dehydrogenase family)